MSLIPSIANYFRSRKYKSYRQIGDNPKTDRISGSVTFRNFEKAAESGPADFCLIALNEPQAGDQLFDTITRELKGMAHGGLLMVYGAIPSTTARLKQVGTAPLSLWKIFSTWGAEMYPSGRRIEGFKMPNLYTAILQGKEVFIIDFAGTQQLPNQYMPAPYFEPQSEAQTHEALVQAVRGKANTIGFVSSVSRDYAVHMPKEATLSPAKFADWLTNQLKKETNATESEPQDDVPADSDTGVELAAKTTGKNSRNTKGVGKPNDAD